ncbi:MAG: betaine/proline/choline family ABC transporter ATP-binding protein [Streptosporangiales bacterium]|nr:betaine/proline/choline family ABC transporter ATP-binding protein [Streptosporangiales bacterium]
MIEARGVSKVFGVPERKAAEALARGRSGRDEIVGAGGVLAVDDVSFTVDRGELFVIMGLSGSGKSTMIRMINKLIPPTAGTVIIGDVDVGKMSDAALRRLRNQRISMVFQHFALFPHRSIKDNVAYGLKVRGMSNGQRSEKAGAALEQVGLAHRMDAYPHELSGGQQQRIGLARALATEADILLMDEPFSALDPLIRRDMQDLLLELQGEVRKTVLFVTHDLNEAMRIGDRIMVMKDGGVVQLGTGPEIIAEPATEYVRDFVSDVDRTRVLTAATIMREPLVVASVDEQPRQVLRKLEGVEAGGVYVLDADRKVVGVAHDKDLAKAGTRPLRELLTDDYETVTEEESIVEFAQRTGNHPVPLGVVDGDGRLCGVVPRAAILAAISGEDDESATRTEDAGDADTSAGEPPGEPAVAGADAALPGEGTSASERVTDNA